MIKNRKGSIRAKKLLEEIGCDEITDIPMEIFVSGLGATLIEEPLHNSDGKIIRGNKKTIIKINSEIQYLEKKRFTIAHEVGHYILHDKLDLEVHNENSNTLNWFQASEAQAKKGIQEWEANDFASELLMPEAIIKKEVYCKKFSPQLLNDLSKRFKTSLTSIIFRLISLNLYSIFVVFISNGIVIYWSKPDDGYYIKIKDITKLPPPSDSLANEYINADYDFIYSGNNKGQEIFKSTWFELSDYDSDTVFYEYCIPTKQYKTIVSVIWEK
ncbi:MAG: ImmA/IrrE family metallo-endopeptidase [Bacteroidales bacterium]|jgi:Zn-dependent peptidase ImmA (M78 family)|nr:ImmA/IrrE family metallo-endopeptidase [Bacteroidales bacterium]